MNNQSLLFSDIRDDRMSDKHVVIIFHPVKLGFTRLCHVYCVCQALLKINMCKRKLYNETFLSFFYLKIKKEKENHIVGLTKSCDELNFGSCVVVSPSWHLFDIFIGWKLMLSVIHKTFVINLMYFVS